MSQEESDRHKKKKDGLAAASAYFGKEIDLYTQVFACSATLSGYILNPIGVFNSDEVIKIFKVYPKHTFAGIKRYVIPEGCELETNGNMSSVDRFKESPSAQKMLHHFYGRKN